MSVQVTGSNGEQQNSGTQQATATQSQADSQTQAGQTAEPKDGAGKTILAGEDGQQQQADNDQKATEGGQQDQADKDAGEAGDDGKTPDYTFDIPEGISLKAEDQGAFNEWATTHKLSPEAAKEAWEMGMNLQSQLQTQLAEKLASQSSEWAEQTQKDPEIGGAKMKETTSTVRRVIQKYGDDDLKEVLNSTGVGNHPAMVRFVARLGALAREDTVERGSEPGGDASIAKKMYPDQK